LGFAQVLPMVANQNYPPDQREDHAKLSISHEVTAARAGLSTDRIQMRLPWGCRW
jgi:hypothetical protein